MKRILITLIALASLTIASQGGGNGNNGSGIPVGSFVITTVEGTLQSASGYNYDVTAFADFPNGGSFDPNGNISLQRSWQGLDANGNYTVPMHLVIYDKNGHVATDYTGGWPANSPFWKTKGKDMGNYMAGYQTDCTNSNPEVGGYGREIIQLVYTAFATNYLPVVIATQYIQLYPYTPTQQNPPTATFSNTLTQSGPLLTFTPNVSTAPVPVNAYQGDPPRITVQLSNLYPGSTTWLVIYPNDPVSNPTQTGSVTIPNTTMTDTADNGLWSRTVTFDLGSALVACGINQSATGPQEYTVEAVQKLPDFYTNIVDPCAQSENGISSVTFSINLNFGIATQLGR
jgi:hypothetical protein